MSRGPLLFFPKYTRGGASSRYRSFQYLPARPVGRPTEGPRPERTVKLYSVNDRWAANADTGKAFTLLAYCC